MEDPKFLPMCESCPDHMEILGCVIVAATEKAKEEGLRSPMDIGGLEFMRICARIADKAGELYATEDENGDFPYDWDDIFELIDREVEKLFQA